jgi:thiol-disulfide isomerase/thioredoxin
MKPSLRRTGLIVALLLGLVGRGTDLLMPPETAFAASALTAVDASSLRAKLAALKGKVVVLNMWATWCGPCVLEFPELVKLDQAYRARGVAVIGLSLDDPKTAQRKVTQFVHQQHVGFRIFTLKPTNAETVVQSVDKYWRGSIPMTYVFDRSGRLRSRLSGARTLDGFVMAVKPLLGTRG